jgi:hypothetical protein
MNGPSTLCTVTLEKTRSWSYPGMIPAVAPPFAMTRWTPQTRQNCAYTDEFTPRKLFQSTRLEAKLIR